MEEATEKAENPSENPIANRWHCARRQVLSGHGLPRGARRAEKHARVERRKFEQEATIEQQGQQFTIEQNAR